MWLKRRMLKMLTSLEKTIKDIDKVIELEFPNDENKVEFMKDIKDLLNKHNGNKLNGMDLKKHINASSVCFENRKAKERMEALCMNALVALDIESELSLCCEFKKTVFREGEFKRKLNMYFTNSFSSSEETNIEKGLRKLIEVCEDGDYLSEVYGLKMYKAIGHIKDQGASISSEELEKHTYPQLFIGVNTNKEKFYSVITSDMKNIFKDEEIYDFQQGPITDIYYELNKFDGLEFVSDQVFTITKKNNEFNLKDEESKLEHHLFIRFGKNSKEISMWHLKGVNFEKEIEMINHYFKYEFKKVILANKFKFS